MTLYQGGQYKHYTYRKYSDVRLVFAPEGMTAFFGGDPDNFNFPRYDLDCSFVRLYEDGKPVKTPDHLVWSTAPPKDGEPVFVAGNPGSTQRLLTADQLQGLRDLALPETLIQFSELRGRLLHFAAESPEHARIANDFLFGIENSFNAFHGEEKALIDPALIAAKRAADNDLKAKVAGNPALAAEIGDPLSGHREGANRIPRALSSLLHRWKCAPASARTCSASPAPWCAPQRRKTKPNGERLPAYADGRLALLSKDLLDPHPVYPELEQGDPGILAVEVAGKSDRRRGGDQDIPGQGLTGESLRPSGAIQAGRSGPA